MDSGAREASGPAAAPHGPDGFADHRVVGPVGDTPSHALRDPRQRGWHTVAAVVGTGAAVLAAVLGVIMLGRPSATGPSNTLGAERISALHITVSRAPQSPLPLSEPQLAGLLARRPDLGALADERRLGSCLRGLGYPSAAHVLGARALAVDGRPGVLLLLPGATATSVMAFVVDPGCSASHTGLLAQTAVSRP